MSFKETFSDFKNYASGLLTKVIEHGYDKDAPTWINEAHNRETALAMEEAVPALKNKMGTPGQKR